MVRVSVCRESSDIQEIIVQGHADYAEHGQDLVCAGVSSICIGMMNALDTLVPDTCEMEMSEGYTRINMMRNSHEVQQLLQAMLIQLTTMEESYQSYIKINEQEV